MKNQTNKYIVWIREDRRWVEQGDGPLTMLQAIRIRNEIARDFKIRTRAEPIGFDPNSEGRP